MPTLKKLLFAEWIAEFRGIEQWYWLFREEGKQSSPSNPFQHPCTNPRVPRGDRWAPAMLWALWVMG